ncbi:MULTISPECIES: hypothetical protein [unclassified Bradyrhizobium]|nr:MULTISPECIES: hypothetical protein [unclassified Bradyrhizobium]WGS20200.1 hypothetical protein MTX22_38940 [Bradyrhizobium sp. ISRA463]WGS27063.1 hypothetical protein MTX19_36365 [Bradyrhizobium sp. ISRA464]
MASGNVSPLPLEQSDLLDDRRLHPRDLDLVAMISGGNTTAVDLGR